MRRHAPQLVAALMLALIGSIGSISVGCEGVVSEPGGTEPPPGPPPPGGAGDVRIERRVWRLSPLHYRAELGRLFGDGVPDVVIPEGAPDHHLTNIAASTRIDIGNVMQFTGAAETVATWLTANPSATRCTDYGMPSCVDTLLGWLPEAAFRREVTSAEVAAFRGLFDDLATTYDYDYAFQAVVRAILLAPDFLYRYELGTDGGSGAVTQLTGYEIATLLAFGITDAGPDTQLFEAAQRGDLADADEREAQARRLMAASKPMWQRFFWEWLHMATLDSQGVEVGLSPSTIQAIHEEHDLFVGNVIVDEEGTLEALLTTTHTWARPELADLYEAAHPGGSGAELVELDATRRAGLLTRMAWLVSHGKDGRDNVVRRGMGIFVDAMCNDISPPAGVDVFAELARLAPPDATVKEIVDVRGSAPGCGACHHLPDPVGLVFEAYASDGTWQTVYPFDGRPVETDATVEGLGSFDDPTVLSGILADDERFQQCMVRRFVHFMVGIDVGSPSNVVFTQDAYEAFTASGTSFEELVVAVVRHPAFIERRR